MPTENIGYGNNYWMSHANQYSATSPQDYVCELIDNALDAEASDVSVNIKQGNLVVTDNGKGIKDIKSALQLGTSVKEGNSIGKYGVGLNIAAAALTNASGQLRVESVSIDSRGQAWKVVGQRDFNGNPGDADIDLAIPTNQKQGTTITIMNLDPSRLDDLRKKLDHKTHRQKLNWIYQNAFEDCKGVTILNHNFERLELKLRDGYEQFNWRSFVGGRPYSGELYILDKNFAISNRQVTGSGCFICINGRVLFSNDKCPFGNVSSSAIYMRINLEGDDWSTNPIKSRVFCDEQLLDDLNSDIKQHTDKYLEVLGSESQEGELQDISDHLTQTLLGIGKHKKTRSQVISPGKSHDKSEETDIEHNGSTSVVVKSRLVRKARSATKFTVVLVDTDLSFEYTECAGVITIKLPKDDFPNGQSHNIKLLYDRIASAVVSNELGKDTKLFAAQEFAEQHAIVLKKINI